MRDGTRRRPPSSIEPNALGKVIEARFIAAFCYAHSYSGLERITGVSREAMSRYVSGRPERYREPPLSTLALFAQVLEWPLGELVDAVLVDVAVMRRAPEEIAEVSYAQGA